VTTYREAGVDIARGDSASSAAYRHAASTFASRKGMIGEPVFEEDGFGGLLDMGDYYLVQTDDGTGTKIDIALHARRCRTLGHDLLAMVADDAVCTGAEVLSVSNTLDVPRIDAALVDDLLAGLAEACTAQKIVIPAGEIAEVPGSVTGAVWSATAVGIVAKDRLLKPSTVAAGDAIVALREPGARSNGFSLIRKILSDRFGAEWHGKQFSGKQTWGEAVLTPSAVYHGALMALLGRYGGKRAVPVRALAHVTGGGIPSKLGRALKASGLGAELSALWEPAAFLAELARLGEVPAEECYRTWSMGNGMLAIVAAGDADRGIALLAEAGIEAKIAGTVTEKPGIVVKTHAGDTLRFGKK